jgi:DNA-binding transcriptional regulator YiaG
MTSIELIKIRNSLKLTQTQLATALHRKRDCIAKWESGKYPIPTLMQKVIYEMAKMGQVCNQD